MVDATTQKAPKRARADRMSMALGSLLRPSVGIGTAAQGYDLDAVACESACRVDTQALQRAFATL